MPYFVIRLIMILVACAIFAGLFWIGAIVCSHVLGISVHDALIGMLTAY